MDTLVLSNSYAPLTRVPWQRAITWLVTGRAELLEEYEDQVVSSPSQVFPMPSVVRFLRKVRGLFNRGVKFSRKNVWLRDKATCQYCGRKVSLSEFTFDHVVPRKLGGVTSWTNIVTCCIPCNQHKGGRTPKQAGMKLLSKPVQPKNLPGGGASIFCGGTMPTTWKDYLGSFSYWYGALGAD